MHRALAVLVLAACDAGAPPPAPPIARPIDAATIIQMDGPRAAIDIPDSFTATRLQPIAAVPADWQHVMSAREIPALELGRSKGAYMVLARDHEKLYATTLSPDPNAARIETFHGTHADDGRSAALLVFGRRPNTRYNFAMVCGQGASKGWSCSPPLPLEDADLRNDLVFSLGAEHGSLELSATAGTPRRRYQITFP